jgi:hypothetical protein
MALDMSKIRWAAAIGFACVTAGLAVYTIQYYVRLDFREGFADIPYNELVKAAIEARTGMSENMFNIGLLLLASLWGLLIAKKDEAGIVLSANPEFISFACASFLLLLSLLSHLFFVNAVMTGFADSGLAFSPDEPSIIDVFDNKIGYFFVMQVFNLVAGSVVAIATLLSAHKVRDMEEI